MLLWFTALLCCDHTMCVRLRANAVSHYSEHPFPRCTATVYRGTYVFLWCDATAHGAAIVLASLDHIKVCSALHAPRSIGLFRCLWQHILRFHPIFYDNVTDISFARSLADMPCNYTPSKPWTFSPLIRSTRQIAAVVWCVYTDIITRWFCQ